MTSFDSIVCPDGVVLAFRRSPTDATDPQLTREEIAMGMLVDQNAALSAENVRLREALRRIYDRANVWFATEPLEIVIHGGVVHGAPIPEIIQEACAALAPGVRP